MHTVVLKGATSCSLHNEGRDITYSTPGTQRLGAGGSRALGHCLIPVLHISGLLSDPDADPTNGIAFKIIAEGYRYLDECIFYGDAPLILIPRDGIDQCTSRRFLNSLSNDDVT
jgi:hypothetical protein